MHFFSIYILATASGLFARDHFMVSFGGGMASGGRVAHMIVTMGARTWQPWNLY